MKTRMVGLFLPVAFLLAAVTSTVVAVEPRQWTHEDDLNGIPLRQGYHVEWYRSMAHDAEGNVMVVWSDTHRGDRDIYGMMIDSDGEQAYDAPVLLAGGFGRQEDPHIMAATDGNWILTWIDYRADLAYEEKGDVYMQKVDDDGNILWTGHQGGLAITGEAGDQVKQISVQSFSDGNGGAVSIWVDGRNGTSDLYAQHVDTDGNVMWDDQGNIIAGGEGDQGNVSGGGGYTADTDGQGGIIAAWVDNRDTGNQNVYSQRIDSNGDRVWDEGAIGGTAICTADMSQGGVKLAPDGMNGAFIIWEDKRFDTSFSDIYGQRIDADGNVYWTVDGEVICDAFNRQETIRIVNTAEGEAIVTWEDTRVAPNIFRDIYMQRIGGDDAIIHHWDEDGIVLVDAEYDQRDLRLTDDGNGGAVMSWVDDRLNTNLRYDLYAQHVDVDGNRTWGDPNGVVVSDAELNQEATIVRMLSDDRALVVYADYREGSPGVYYQVFGSDGSIERAENGDLIIYGIDFNARWPKLILSDNNILDVWKDGRYSNDYGFIQGLDITGETLWQQNGINATPGLQVAPSEEASISFLGLMAKADNNGGVFTAWHDTRVNYVNNVFLQHVNDLGEPQWGDSGLALDNSIYEQTIGDLIPTDDGGVIVIYVQSNPETFFLDLFAYRLDASGVPVWDDPLPIAVSESDKVVNDVEVFDDGSVFVVYRATDPFAETDLKATAFNPDGTLTWDEPMVLSDEVDRQYHGRATKVSGGIAVVWIDERRGTPIKDIYGQFVMSDGTTAWEDGGLMLIAEENAQENISIDSNMGHLSESFWVAWQDNRDPNNPDIYTQLFDLDGMAMLAPASGYLVTMSEEPEYEPVFKSLVDNSIYITYEVADTNDFRDLYYKH
ncbi:hypothetical protein GF324_09715, partial [bacterium]|nr:hypothetical protein [bacterium]